MQFVAHAARMQVRAARSQGRLSTPAEAGVLTEGFLFGSVFVGGRVRLCPHQVEQTIFSATADTLLSDRAGTSIDCITGPKIKSALQDFTFSIRGITDLPVVASLLGPQGLAWSPYPKN
jgi:hypothetical protein